MMHYTHMCVRVMNIHAQYASGVCVGVCVSSDTCIRTNALIWGFRNLPYKGIQMLLKAFLCMEKSWHKTSVDVLPAIWNGKVCVYTRYVFIHLNKSIMLLRLSGGHSHGHETFS